MRFTKEKQLRDDYIKSTRKTKTKFLWLPLTIYGETRWLETATIEYRVTCEEGLFSDKIYYWKPFNFIDEQNDTK
jgi:hypothetical protein